MDRRAGFTLIELLVALALGGLIIGSILQILTGQARFVELQSGREEAQQNARAALELISSELRGIPDGDALVRAASDSITFRAPRLWGVVCATRGASSLDVTFPSLTDVSYVTNLGTGVVVNVGSPALPDWTGAVELTGVGGAGQECAGEPLGPGAERRTLTLGAMPLAGTSAPAAGDIVYVFDQVTYRASGSAGLPGTWISRRIGDGPGASNQPFAGPVDGDGDGLRFEYFGGESSAPLATPVSDAAARASVDRIAVIVSSVSRLTRSNLVQSRTDTIFVPLRNRVWTGS